MAIEYTRQVGDHHNADYLLKEDTNHTADMGEIKSPQILRDLMWREPKLHDLDAPKEYKEKINASIYFNQTGKMRGAGRATILQYVISLFLSWVILIPIISLLFYYIFSTSFNSPIVYITSILVGLGMGAAFVWWGWYRYDEAWYHFDDLNQIFSVIRRSKEGWELFEIPYDTVDEIEFSGGENGFATIHAGGFAFDTTRERSQRFASVTELWDQLAKFDTHMTNWPIILECPKCEREFGHHIGTAQCPFDEVILIDPTVKGRIDPEEIHPDDRERV